MNPLTNILPEGVTPEDFTAKSCAVVAEGLVKASHELVFFAQLSIGARVDENQLARLVLLRDDEEFQDRVRPVLLQYAMGAFYAAYCDVCTRVAEEYGVVREADGDD